MKNRLKENKSWKYGIRIFWQPKQILQEKDKF